MMNTPLIRFKGFTDAWEQRKLGDVADEVKRTDSNSTAPVMMITAQNGFIEQSERYAFDNSGESLKKYILLERGELAYNHGASKLRPYGSCFALTTKENARIPFVYHCFSVRDGDPEFISTILNGSQTESQLRKIVSSGARMDGLLNISYQEYCSISILLPKIEEQHEISELFRSLDHLITLHQREYDKTVNIKKAMLEKMFPKDGATVPEIRFKGFTDAWEQRRLREVADIVRGASPRPIKDPKWFDDESDIGWLRISDVTEQDGRIHFLEQHISEAGQEMTRVLTEPHLLLSIAATVGKPVINYVKTGVHDGFLIFQNPNFDREFMFQWLEMFRPKWSKYGQPGSQVNLNSDLVKGKDIMLPNMEEQSKIGSFFHSLDHLITLHQRELQKLQNIKKSLLEKMFV